MEYDPEKFIKTRCAPLIAVTIDPGVERLAKLCGFSMIDLLQVVGRDSDDPIRFVEISSIKQGNFEDCLKIIEEDMNDYSKSFISPDFERDGTTQPATAPFPKIMPPKLPHKYLREHNPPWYDTMFCRLLDSMQYADFNFSDLPAAFMNVVIAGEKPKTSAEFRSTIVLPKWMREFTLQIPTICLVVNDSLVSKEEAVNTSFISGYTLVLKYSIRSRKVNTAPTLSRDYLVNFFGMHRDAVNSPNLGNFISEIDLTKAQTIVKDINNKMLRPNIDIASRALQVEIDNNNKLSSTIKGWFAKAPVQRITNHLSLMWKRVIYLQHAAYALSLGKIQEANRDFRAYGAGYEYNEPQSLKMRVYFYTALTGMINNQNGYVQFAGQMADFMREIGQVTCNRTFLLIPMLTIEIHAHVKNFLSAITICERLIEKVGYHWRKTPKERAMVMAILYDRLSSLKDNKSSLLHLVSAAQFYKECGFEGHVIREMIWLSQALPLETWHLLHQKTRLDEAVLLSSSFGQHIRSLVICKELLDQPTLHRQLQCQVINQFWDPFKIPELQEEINNLSLQLNNLVQVKKIQVIDPSLSTFFGYQKADFNQMVKDFDNWFESRVMNSSSISFEELWDDKIKIDKKITIACDSEVTIRISVIKPYAFSVHLNRASLNAKFEGHEAPQFEIESIENIDIDKSIDIDFKFIPRSQGKFIINKFEKNYWGYVNTSSHCGPLTFTAIHGFPQVKLHLIDFPETVSTYNCIYYSFLIENIGQAPIKSLRFAFDNTSHIVYEGKIHTINDISVIHVTEEIEEGGNYEIPLVLRVPNVRTMKIRYFIDIAGNKCAYYLQDLKVKRSISVNVKTSKAMSNSSCQIHKLEVTALNEGISIDGVCNANGQYMELFDNERTTSAIKKGDKRTVLFKSTHVSDKKVDEWRTSRFDKSKIGYFILFNDGISKCLSQYDIYTNLIPQSSMFKINIETNVTTKPGSIIKCELVYEGPEMDPLYLEPLPLILRGNVVSSIAGCRWIGKTRVILSKENTYKATLSFIALEQGIYLIKGFNMAVNKSFSDARPIEVSQNIAISFSTQD